MAILPASIIRRPFPTRVVLVTDCATQAACLLRAYSTQTIKAYWLHWLHSIGTHSKLGLIYAWNPETCANQTILPRPVITQTSPNAAIKCVTKRLCKILAGFCTINFFLPSPLWGWACEGAVDGVNSTNSVLRQLFQNERHIIIFSIALSKC
jgi:hypothetical protein